MVEGAGDGLTSREARIEHHGSDFYTYIVEDFYTYCGVVQNPGRTADIKRSTSRSAPFPMGTDSMEGTTDNTMPQRSISPGVCTVLECMSVHLVM